jgi:hypothetical protein
MELTRRFGDRNITIIGTRHRLSTASIGSGPQHEQLETLCQQVSLAETALTAVGAQDMLFDITTVGILVSKLTHHLQSHWAFHRTELQEVLSPIEQGEAFKKWRDRARRAADFTRLQAMGVEMSKNEKHTNSSNNECTICGKSGHKAATCNKDKDQTLEVFATQDTDLGKRNQRVQWENEEQMKDSLKSATERASPCPVCGEKHTFSKSTSWSTVYWPSFRLDECAQFSALPRSDVGETRWLCFVHSSLSQSEQVHNCQIQNSSKVPN